MKKLLLAFILGGICWTAQGNIPGSIKVDNYFIINMRLEFNVAAGRINKQLDLGLGFVGDPLLKNFQVSVYTNTFVGYSEVTNETQHFYIQIRQGALEILDDFRNNFTGGEEQFKKWCGKKPKLTADQALEKARNVLTNLGLSEEKLQLKKPEVEHMSRDKTDKLPECKVPFYMVQWFDSKGDGVAMQIHGMTGQLTRYSNGSSFLPFKELPEWYVKQLELHRLDRKK